MPVTRIHKTRQGDPTTGALWSNPLQNTWLTNGITKEHTLQIINQGGCHSVSGSNPFAPLGLPHFHAAESHRVTCLYQRSFLVYLVLITPHTPKTKQFLSVQPSFQHDLTSLHHHRHSFQHLHSLRYVRPAIQRYVSAYHPRILRVFC